MNECPTCGGLLTLLGRLGSLLWLRCRQCGMDCSISAEDFDE